MCSSNTLHSGFHKRNVLHVVTSAVEESSFLRLTKDRHLLSVVFTAVPVHKIQMW